MFKALYLTQSDDRTLNCALTELDESQLPAGEVLVQVSHSTLNYKDGLAITGKAPVVRSFPMVPGIDFAGTVLESSDPRYKQGDAVILNGWGVGETHWGGLAQKARVKADWLVPMPAGMTAAKAMALGTAGYTAMLCVMRLQQQGITPDQGPVLVTGANGGVGTIAIALLSRLGYTVHASTGRMHEAEHLKALGASELVDRASGQASNPDPSTTPAAPSASQPYCANCTSLPASVTPRRMNGATVPGKSMPCASPQAATTPPLPPVTSTGPRSGGTPCCCSAITHSMAV